MTAVVKSGKALNLPTKVRISFAPFQEPRKCVIIIKHKCAHVHLDTRDIYYLTITVLKLNCTMRLVFVLQARNPWKETPALILVDDLAWIHSIYPSCKGQWFQKYSKLQRKLILEFNWQKLEFSCYIQIVHSLKEWHRGRSKWLLCLKYHCLFVTCNTTS